MGKSRNRTEVNLLVTFVYSSDFFLYNKTKKKGERKWYSVNPRERIEVVLSIIAAVCNRSTNCSCFRFSKWIILLKVLDINAVKLDEITRRLSMVFRLWRLCTQLIQRHCSKKINNAFFHSSMFQNIHKKRRAMAWFRAVEWKTSNPKISRLKQIQCSYSVSAYQVLCAIFSTVKKP